MAGPYDLGDEVILAGEFRNDGDDLVDPADGVTLTIRLPDGSKAFPTPTKLAVGLYEASYTPTLEGIHWYRWAGTGANRAAGETSFTVTKSRVI